MTYNDLSVFLEAASFHRHTNYLLCLALARFLGVGAPTHLTRSVANEQRYFQLVKLPSHPNP